MSTSHTEDFEEMGCTRSKLNNKICESSETSKTHKKYIREKGLDAYNKVMGFNHGVGRHTMDDHSSTYNVGLVNLNNKSESETENEYVGLTFKEYVEIAFAILFIIYAGRFIVRHFIKKKKNASVKKKTKLKELVEEATSTPTAPSSMMTTQFSQIQPPVTTIAIPQNQQKKMENQIIPIK